MDTAGRDECREGRAFTRAVVVAMEPHPGVRLGQSEGPVRLGAAPFRGPSDRRRPAAGSIRSIQAIRARGMISRPDASDRE